MTEAVKKLLATLAHYDRASLAPALTQTVALDVELRQAFPPPRPVPHMPTAMSDFIGQSRK